MGHRTAALVLFESTLAYQALLRLEGPLIENGFFQCLSQLLIKPLFPANGTKLGQIVLVPGCIVFANLLFPYANVKLNHYIAVFERVVLLCKICEQQTSNRIESLAIESGCIRG
jgi:hypothetical protein